jgi:hypothetical protein
MIFFISAYKNSPWEFQVNNFILYILYIIQLNKVKLQYIPKF